MGTEIEVKFMLEKGEPAEVEYFAEKAGFHTIKKELLNLDNRYFDTPDGSLAANGIALRLRNTNGSLEMTVKVRRSKQGGVHIHPEYNIDLGKVPAKGMEQLLPDINKFPEEIFSGLNIKETAAALQPTMGQLCLRHIYLVEGEPYDHKAQIEISTDEVKYRGISGPVYEKEIELELKSGDSEDLHYLAIAVAAVSGDKFQIRAGTISKMYHAALYAGLAEFPAGKAADKADDAKALLHRIDSAAEEFMLYRRRSSLINVISGIEHAGEIRKQNKADRTAEDEFLEVLVNEEEHKTLQDAVQKAAKLSEEQAFAIEKESLLSFLSDRKFLKARLNMDFASVEKNL